MKIPSFLYSLLTACCSFFLSSLAALSHPGHYHPPDEVDEFDTFRAGWLHLHGAWEFLIVIALLSAYLFYSQPRIGVRIIAAALFGGSLLLIAAH